MIVNPVTARFRGRRTTAQAEVNARVWSRQNFVRAYATRLLSPAEVVALLHHRDALRGRVLELGCGAGRLTGYLIELGGDVLGTDVSAAMLEHCRRTYPRGRFDFADIADLSGFATGSFDAIVAGDHLIDVLDDTGRRAALTEMRRILVPGGLLLMSSHNAAAADGLRMPWHVLERNPVAVARNVLRLPRRLRNRARLVPHEVRTPDYAVLNDLAHDFSLLHYYVEPDAQSRQFEEAGFEVLERLDRSGDRIGPGDRAPESSGIVYVARTGPPDPGLEFQNTSP